MTPSDGIIYFSKPPQNKLNKILNQIGEDIPEHACPPQNNPGDKLAFVFESNRINSNIILSFFSG
jgi:hypothetical protein